jgi:hypothetical protein
MSDFPPTLKEVGMMVEQLARLRRDNSALLKALADSQDKTKRYQAAISRWMLSSNTEQATMELMSFFENELSS